MDLNSRGNNTFTIANMKSQQCIIAASMGNQIIGFIRRNITYRPKENGLIVHVYKAIARPHL